MHDRVVFYSRPNFKVVTDGRKLDLASTIQEKTLPKRHDPTSDFPKKHSQQKYTTFQNTDCAEKNGAQGSEDGFQTEEDKTDSKNKKMKSFQQTPETSETAALDDTASECDQPPSKAEADQTSTANNHDDAEENILSFFETYQPIADKAHKNEPDDTVVIDVEKINSSRVIHDEEGRVIDANEVQQNEVSLASKVSSETASGISKVLQDVIYEESEPFLDEKSHANNKVFPEKGPIKEEPFSGKASSSASKELYLEADTNAPKKLEEKLPEEKKFDLENTSHTSRAFPEEQSNASEILEKSSHAINPPVEKETDPGNFFKEDVSDAIEHLPEKLSEENMHLHEEAESNERLLEEISDANKFAVEDKSDASEDSLKTAFEKSKLLLEKLPSGSESSSAEAAKSTKITSQEETNEGSKFASTFTDEPIDGTRIDKLTDTNTERDLNPVEPSDANAKNFAAAPTDGKTINQETASGIFQKEVTTLLADVESERLDVDLPKESQTDIDQATVEIVSIADEDIENESDLSTEDEARPLKDSSSLVNGEDAATETFELTKPDQATNDKASSIDKSITLSFNQINDSHADASLANEESSLPNEKSDVIPQLKKSLEPENIDIIYDQLQQYEKDVDEDDLEDNSYSYNVETEVDEQSYHVEEKRVKIVKDSQ